MCGLWLGVESLGSLLSRSAGVCGLGDLCCESGERVATGRSEWKSGGCGCRVDRRELCGVWSSVLSCELGEAVSVREVTGCWESEECWSTEPRRAVVFSWWCGRSLASPERCVGVCKASGKESVLEQESCGFGEVGELLKAYFSVVGRIAVGRGMIYSETGIREELLEVNGSGFPLILVLLVAIWFNFFYFLCGRYLVPWLLAEQ